MRVAEYITDAGRSPFSKWFEGLDPGAAIRVAAALVRIRNGGTSNLKGVGRGVFEWRIDSGPGYRSYFGRVGDEIVVLLGGGTKRRQQADIESAIGCWRDYKTRRRLMWR